MKKVVVIGQGNVASHFIESFTKSKAVELIHLNSRNLEIIPTADIYIIAVTDDAIQAVSKQLGNTTALVVHTSGTVALEAISQSRKGVFYPLQSFSKNKTVDFHKVPFCLEVNQESDFTILSELANILGAKHYAIDSKQRKKLHLAAVFVNNFTNHMYQIGQEICEEHQVPFEILYPLIEETSKKINTLSPKEAQTGPAKRNDIQTINNHLEQLNSQQQKIYKIITKSIQEN